MGFIMDMTLAIPIGIIYNMIIHESTSILNENFNYKDKKQRNLLFVFGGGLLGFIIAFSFSLNGGLRYGLFLGSIILIAHSIIYNWTSMQNDTRIIVMILSLGALIWYSYTYNLNEKNKKKYDNENKNENDNDDENDNDNENGNDNEYIDNNGLKMSSLLPLTYEQYENHDDENDENDTN